MAIASAPPQQWDLSKHGMQQLDQLNAMERQQDTNLWASSAIYAATNGVLLLAFMSVVAEGLILGIPLGAVGLMVTAVWHVTALRAHAYERLWIEKAKRLQADLGVPPRYAVWDRERPPGMSAQFANRLLRYAFITTWILVLALGLISGLAWALGLPFP